MLPELPQTLQSWAPDAHVATIMLHLGAITAPLGDIMVHLGRDLTPSWTQLRSSCAHLRPNFARSSDQSAPKIPRTAPRAPKTLPASDFLWFSTPLGWFFMILNPLLNLKSTAERNGLSLPLLTITQTCMSALWMDVHQPCARKMVCGGWSEDCTASSSVVLALFLVSPWYLVSLACRDDLAHVWGL